MGPDPSSTFQDQAAPVFAALPDGGFVAAWTDVDGFNDPGVNARLFDASGNPVGDVFRVNSHTAMVQAGPSVTALPSGNFVITWTDETAYPDTFDIHGQLYSPEGVPIGSEFLANTTTVGFQTGGIVAPLADGGFVVVWEQALDTGYDNARAQMFDASGTKMGGEIAVSDAEIGDNNVSDVVGLADGGFVVAWSDAFADSKAQMFDANGHPVGSIITLNSFPEGYQLQPVLAAVPTGGFVAAWSDDGDRYIPGGPNGNQGIWFQLFDADGAKQGDAVHASSGGAGQGSPAIDILPGVGFLLTWTDSNTTAENDPGHLTAQLYDFSGQPVGDAFPVNPYLYSGQSQPGIAILADGSLVVGWTDLAGPQYNDENVKARLFASVKQGTAGNDVFTGGAGENFYVGHGGNDHISGGDSADGLAGEDGNDSIYGGGGADEIYGGAGKDLIQGGHGDDLLYGDDGDDVFSLRFGDGTDHIDGGAGYDAIRVDGNSVSIDWTLVSGIEMVNGSTYANARIVGTAGDDVMDLTGVTLRNVARIDGGDGNDTIRGSAGGDTLYGGLGDDTLYGGDGNDVFAVTANSGVDTLYGGNGTDAIRGVGNSASVVWPLVSGIEAVDGGGYSNFRILGTSGDDSIDLSQVKIRRIDRIDGGEGRDAIHGSVGGDLIYGSGGDDSLYGGDGRDALHGGAGSDTLAGGAGKDSFWFDARPDGIAVDAILDFTAADDVIRLAHGAFAALPVGNLAAPAFYEGTAAHDASDRILYDAATGDIFYDPDGTGAQAALLFAHVAPHTPLTNADFVVA